MVNLSNIRVAYCEGAIKNTLDELTNHLDIAACEAWREALRVFKGGCGESLSRTT